jgi:hypothetical protein
MHIDSLGLFQNRRGEGVDVVFVAREAYHEHHIFPTTTAVPREPSLSGYGFCKVNPTPARPSHGAEEDN